MYFMPMGDPGTFQVYERKQNASEREGESEDERGAGTLELFAEVRKITI